LDRAAGVIQVRNLANEVTKKVAPPCASVDGLFYAGTGLLLCRAEDRVVLFDVQQRLALAELPTPPVKCAFWFVFFPLCLFMVFCLASPPQTIHPLN
jgi:coatomer protein complex subunit alpha (xenin)